MSCTAFWAVHTLRAMKLTDVGQCRIQCVEILVRKNMKKVRTTQPLVKIEDKKRVESLLRCNKSESNTIQSHLGTRSWQKHHNLKKYQQFHHNQRGWIGFQNHSCSLQLWKGTQFFLISAIRHFVATLRFPKHSRFSRSNRTRMPWHSNVGPIEMPVKLDPSVCRIFLNSAEIPFMKANIQSFSADAERLCESLGHGKRFAWT